MAVSKLNAVSASSMPPGATAKLYSGASSNGVFTTSLSAGKYAIKAISGAVDMIGNSFWSTGSSYKNANRVVAGPVNSDKTVYVTLSTSDTAFAVTSTGVARRYNKIDAITGAIAGSFVYGNGKYCSALYDGTNWYFISSTDGIDWNVGIGVPQANMGNPGASVAMVAALNNMYFMGGNGGPIQYSTDGDNFSTAGSQTTGALRDMAYGLGYYVAVSNTSTSTSNLTTSTDGINWTARNSNCSSAINAIAFGNGIFVGISQSGRITTSTDGTNWSFSTPMSGALWGITFGNGKFVVVSQTGNIWTSTNGTTWTQTVVTDQFEPMTPYQFKPLSYGGGKYWMSCADDHHGFQSSISSSTDGITWTRTYGGISDSSQALLNANTYYPGPTAYGNRLLSINRGNASGVPQVIEYPTIAYEIYSVA